MLNTLIQPYIRLASSFILDLNSETSYITNSLEAFGMAPFHRLAERSTQQHGVTDLGFRLDPRVFNIHMSLRAAAPYLYWTERSQLLETFRPSDTPFVIFLVIPNGLDPDLTRSIDCYLQKGPSFDTSKRKGLVQEADITLIAPDPTFYDPVPVVVDTALSLAVPTTNTPIGYTGTWLTYPIIEIKGPIANPSIYNPDNGEKLALTYTILEGETVLIDTAYGKKTVMKGSTNLISYLTTDSDLATFHIQHEDFYSHANVFTIAGAVPAGKTAHVKFTFFTRFIGV